MMFALTTQVIVESIKTLADLNNDNVDAATATVVILVLTIGIKLVLFIYCKCFVKGSPSVQALAQDQFNDMLTNSFAILGLYLGAKLGESNHKYRAFDPVFAIILSLYIMRNWFRTGREQLVKLSGRTAPNSFLKTLTFMAWNHSKVCFILFPFLELKFHFRPFFFPGNQVHRHRQSVQFGRKVFGGDRHCPG